MAKFMIPLLVTLGLAVVGLLVDIGVRIFTTMGG
jgi:hypothetical protein